MKYYYKGKPLRHQFPIIRYNRITTLIREGRTVEEAIEWTKVKHLWTPSKYKHKEKSCYQICKEIGLNYRTFLGRINRGLPIKDCLKIRKTKKQIEWEKTHEQ